MKPLPFEESREHYYTLLKHEHDLIKDDDKDIRKLGKEVIKKKALAFCFRDRKDIIVCSPLDEGGEKIAQASYDFSRGSASFGWFCK